MPGGNQNTIRAQCPGHVIVMRHIPDNRIGAGFPRQQLHRPFHLAARENPILAADVRKAAGYAKAFRIFPQGPAFKGGDDHLAPVLPLQGLKRFPRAAGKRRCGRQTVIFLHKLLRQLLKRRLVQVK